MIHKLYILTASPIFIFLLSNNIWSLDIQIDSTIKTIDVPIEINGKDFRTNLNELYYPHIGSYNIYNLPDSLTLLLNMDLLNQRLNSNYIFQSSLSEQWRINEQLTNYIQFNKNLALKSELGVFGKVLGKARTITAIILAILHVVKYRKGLY